MIFSLYKKRKHQKFIKKSEEFKQAVTKFNILKNHAIQFRNHDLLTHLIKLTSDMDEELLAVYQKCLSYGRNVDECFFEQCRRVYLKAFRALLEHLRNQTNDNVRILHRPNAYDGYDNSYYF